MKRAAGSILLIVLCLCFFTAGSTVNKHEDGQSIRFLGMSSNGTAVFMCSSSTPRLDESREVKFNYSWLINSNTTKKYSQKFSLKSIFNFVILEHIQRAERICVQFSTSSSTAQCRHVNEALDLLPPSDVHVTSVNYNHSVSWMYKPTSSAILKQITFTVEFTLDDPDLEDPEQPMEDPLWYPVEQCENIRDFHCDLFNEYHDPDDLDCPDLSNDGVIRVRVKPCISYHREACGKPVEVNPFVFAEQSVINPPKFSIARLLPGDQLLIENKPYFVSFSHKSLSCYYDNALVYEIKYYGKNERTQPMQEKLAVSFDMTEITLPLISKPANDTVMCVRMRIMQDLRQHFSKWRESCKRVSVTTISDEPDDPSYTIILIVSFSIVGLVVLSVFGWKLKHYHYLVCVKDKRIPSEMVKMMQEIDDDVARVPNYIIYTSRTDSASETKEHPEIFDPLILQPTAMPDQHRRESELGSEYNTDESDNTAALASSEENSEENLVVNGEAEEPKNNAPAELNSLFYVRIDNNNDIIPSVPSNISSVETGHLQNSLSEVNNETPNHIQCFAESFWNFQDKSQETFETTPNKLPCTMMAYSTETTSRHNSFPKPVHKDLKDFQSDENFAKEDDDRKQEVNYTSVFTCSYAANATKLSNTALNKSSSYSASDTNIAAEYRNYHSSSSVSASSSLNNILTNRRHSIEKQEIGSKNPGKLRYSASDMDNPIYYSAGSGALAAECALLKRNQVENYNKKRIVQQRAKKGPFRPSMENQIHFVPSETSSPVVDKANAVPLRSSAKNQEHNEIPTKQQKDTAGRLRSSKRSSLYRKRRANRRIYYGYCDASSSWSRGHPSLSLNRFPDPFSHNTKSVLPENRGCVFYDTGQTCYCPDCLSPPHDLHSVRSRTDSYKSADSGIHHDMSSFSDDSISPPVSPSDFFLPNPTISSSSSGLHENQKMFSAKRFFNFPALDEIPAPKRCPEIEMNSRSSCTPSSGLPDIRESPLVNTKLEGHLCSENVLTSEPESFQDAYRRVHSADPNSNSNCSMPINSSNSTRMSLLSDVSAVSEYCRANISSSVV